MGAIYTIVHSRGTVLIITDGKGYRIRRPMMTRLSTTLAGISFPSCLINASGAWSGTREELRELAASATGAVVIKTTTTAARVEEVKGCGIENPGQPYYLALLSELKAAGKPIIGSVAGFTTAEYVELAQAYGQAGVQIVELNLSDPVVTCNQGGSCNLAAVDEVMHAVRAAVRTPLAVKLPMLPNGVVGKAVELLRRQRIELLVCNTPQLAAFVPAVGGALDLIAVGGVSNGKDVQAALSCGAKAVQIGSALMKEGPGVFWRIQQELIAERTTHESGA
jgi:dihydroorotate dehydrogenase (fumarate)